MTSMVPEFERRKEPRLPSWAIYSVAFVGLCMVMAEAFVDFERQTDIGRWVIWIDDALVIGYTAWLTWLGFRRREDIRSFLYERRLMLLMMLCSWVLLFIAPRAAAIGVIARLSYVALRRFVRSMAGRGLASSVTLSPSRTLALSFLGLIGTGTLLLLFPAATRDGLGTSLTDAVFTMASATSVTGLIVQDTGTYFSAFGLGVILLVMQTGAIGIMVLAASFAVLVGGRLPGRDQEGLEEAGFGDVVDVSTVEGLKRLILAVTVVTVVIESAGALILYFFWMVDIMPLRDAYSSWDSALWWCIFHSVSAFCHAGFSLEPDSLMTWVNNPFVGGVFMVLITLGAFGFPVLADLAMRDHYRAKKRVGQVWRTYHIQTRVVLVATFVLNGFGMLFFLFFEYDAALDGLSVWGKINASLFQSITLRSAGFNTVDIGAITAPTIIFSVAYMFIGSAPASTGGGVRTTTASVVLMAIRAMLRGRDDVEIFGRTLPKTIVYRSISIVLIAGFLCATFLILVTATQSHLPFNKLIFETISAFGTVGLSMGVTSELDTTGKWLLAILMYFGRVGPMTLALAVGERAVTRAYQYPEGRMAVG